MSTKEASVAAEPAEAAEIALAMSECMNLLFLFAAPRVLTAVRRSGGVGLDGPSQLASLRRFLHQASAIRSRARTGAPVTMGETPKPVDDVERLVRAAMLVEEIAGVIAALPVLDPMPAAVVDRARRSLSILGFEEPKGGWEEFEGFAVPYPPPSPRSATPPG